MPRNQNAHSELHVPWTMASDLISDELHYSSLDLLARNPSFQRLRRSEARVHDLLHRPAARTWHRCEAGADYEMQRNSKGEGARKSDAARHQQMMPMMIVDGATQTEESVLPFQEELLGYAFDSRQRVVVGAEGIEEDFVDDSGSMVVGGDVPADLEGMAETSDESVVAVAAYYFLGEKHHQRL